MDIETILCSEHECRDMWQPSMLRISDNGELSSKLDIYVTPSTAQVTL